MRFACCERRRKGDSGGEAWGKVLWCVQIELAEDEPSAVDDGAKRGEVLEDGGLRDDID